MDHNKKTILVIEDELPMLRALADEFADNGFAVLKAKDGREGLHIALLKHPDLIVLDIIMPHLGGLGVLRELRNDSWGKGVPVVLLTNINTPVQVAEAEKYGVSAYLVKTEYRLEDISETLKKILSPNTLAGSSTR